MGRPVEGLVCLGARMTPELCNDHYAAAARWAHIECLAALKTCKLAPGAILMVPQIEKQVAQWVPLMRGFTSFADPDRVNRAFHIKVGSKIFPILRQILKDGESMKPHPPIKTEFIYPPIPTRAFDWQAWCDGWEEQGPTGAGPTELAAIADLQDQLEDDGHEVRRVDAVTLGALDLIDEYIRAQYPEPSLGNPMGSPGDEHARRISYARAIRSHILEGATAYPNENSGTNIW